MYFTCHFFSLDFILVIPFFTFILKMFIFYFFVLFSCWWCLIVISNYGWWYFYTLPKGIENLKPLTSVTSRLLSLSSWVLIYMYFNPQKTFLLHVTKRADYISKCFVLTTRIIRLFPLSLSIFRQGCISFCLKDVSVFRLYQLVSENVCFILKHLMLKEAVQQDWSQEPRGH